jgi:hypothetical protein
MEITDLGPLEGTFRTMDAEHALMWSLDWLTRWWARITVGTG